MQGYHDECHDDEVADDHDMHDHNADDIEVLGKPTVLVRVSCHVESCIVHCQV